MTVEIIPLDRILFAFLPVAFLIILMWRWKLNYKNVAYAMGRMLVQLLTVGYVLIYIFNTQSSAIVVAIIMAMVLISSWIALNT